jgi:PAS domain S-box-containing protein
VLDLSEQKKIEAELRQSENQFRLLAEAIPQIVWTSRPSGINEFSNKRFYEFCGVDPADDNGRMWETMIHPDDRERVVTLWKKALQDGTVYNTEYRLPSKTGEYHWFLARAVPLRDQDGKITTWFGTSTDINDQKRAVEQLQRSESELRTLADAIPHIVFTAQPDGTIDFFNHRWFEYTGLTLEQSRSGAWQLLIHPQDLDSYMTKWKKALETGDSHEMEFRLKRAIGIGKHVSNPYLWHLARAVALHDGQGQIIKWFATWTEIENQKRKD